MNIWTLRDASSPIHVLAWLQDDVIENLLNISSSETRFIFNFISNDIEASKNWYNKFKELVKDI